MTAIAVPAWGAPPVNLRCSLDFPEGQRGIDVTLNEAEGTATWQWDNSPEPIKNSALFTATKVVMGLITIDRVTLEIRRTNPDFLVKEKGYPPVTLGKCRIREVKRAF